MDGDWIAMSSPRVQIHVGEVLGLRFGCGLDRWTVGEILFAPEATKIGTKS